MNTTSSCPHCNHVMKVDGKHIGRKTCCQKCERAFILVDDAEAAFRDSNVTQPYPNPSAFFPVAQPVQQSAVNVQTMIQTGKVANGFATAGFCIGLFAVLVCWVPVIGIMVSGVASALCVFGFLTAIKHNGSGMLFTIFGGLMSGFALLISFIIFLIMILPKG